MDQRVVFRFSTLRLRSKKNISFVFWGLVGLKAKKWKPWSKMHFKSFEALLANVVFLPPPPHPARGGGVLFDYSVNPVLPFEILNSQRVVSTFEKFSGGGVVVVACLIIVSTLAQILPKSRPGPGA